MRKLVVLGCLLLAVPQTHAIDGVSFELGTSDSSNVSVDMARTGVQWDWSKRWALGSAWHLGGYWDLAVAYWNIDSRNRASSGIADVGFTPVFRIQQTNPGDLAPYIEAGIGLHYISKTSINPQRRLSIRFQFADHIGAGLRFGFKHVFDLGYRYQHLSNGGIKHPNNGINFHQVRLQYHF